MTGYTAATGLARELKRGTLEMIILALLTERPMYGFELISEMRERSGGGFEMKEGTLYPVLYRMEAGALVKSHWDAEGRAVPRKYYHVTASGRKEHDHLVAEWSSFTAAVSRILGAAGTTGNRRKT
jgi:PadR family transcriptional regulator PadR